MNSKFTQSPLMADNLSEWLVKHRSKASIMREAQNLYHELEDSVRLMCNNCHRCELDTKDKPMFASQACEAYTRKVAVLRKARGEI